MNSKAVRSNRTFRNNNIQSPKRHELFVSSSEKLCQKLKNALSSNYQLNSFVVDMMGGQYSVVLLYHGYLTTEEYDGFVSGYLASLVP